MEKPRLIFITGGARSGKSSFAEEYAASLAEKEERKLYYIATANLSDDEMIDRIKRHQNERKRSSFHWETVESPTNLINKVDLFSPHSVVLLDCLTIWLSNELDQHGFYEDKWGNKDVESMVMKSIIDGIDALLDHVKVLIIVSNEVVYDPMRKEALLVQAYCKVLGLLHQHIVRESDKAYAIEAGIALLMKEDNRCKES